jgi:hypothetical protein
MSMTTDFEIHLTNEDPRQDTKVRSYARKRKQVRILQSKEGKELKNVKVALFSYENPFLEEMLKDADLHREFLDFDRELDLEVAGKLIGRTSQILLNSEYQLCYNFTEYEIKRNREGKIIPCETCGEIYCEHRIKRQTKANIDLDRQPVRWISVMMIDKLKVIKTWSFSQSYQIRHVDGLTYKHLYDMAKILHESNKMVLMAPIEQHQPQKLVLRNAGKPFYGWLEGRIQGDKYALILHRTTLKLVD